MQTRRTNIPSRKKQKRHIASQPGVQTYAIRRFCAASDCSHEITGHTGKYCCPACYQREYYRRHKKKIAKQRAARTVKQILSPEQAEITPATPASLEKEPVPTAIPVAKKQSDDKPLSTDMLSVSEAAKRLKVCRQTLYNLEAAGVIRILHLTSRLSFIRWSDLLALFDDPNMYGKPKPDVQRNKLQNTKRPATARIQAEPNEWCDIEQACLRYNTSANAIRQTVFRHKIPRKKSGKTAFYSTAHLDSARGYTKGRRLQGYITAGEASKKYNIPISTVRYRIRSFGLKTILWNKKIMFEEAAFKRRLRPV